MEDEEMNLAELLKQTTEENQTRKILAIMAESKDLEDAKEKVKALLKKQGNITHNIREQKTKTFPANYSRMFLTSTFQQESKKNTRGNSNERIQQRF